MKKIKEINKVEFPKILETFRDIGAWEFNQISQPEPSCFNDRVRINKYKITVEEINEPNEVYGERLERLWINSNNHHDIDPLKKAATKIGYEFKGEWGSNKK